MSDMKLPANKVTQPVTPTSNPKIVTGKQGQSATMYGNLNLSQTPSTAAQQYGKNLKVYGPTAQTATIGRNTTPSDTSATGSVGTKVSSPAGQDYLNGLMNQAKNIQSQIPGATSSDASYQNSPEYKAYLKYKRDQENPSEQSNLLKAQTDAYQRLADIQSNQEKMNKEARDRYEKLLDAPGGLKAGAEQSAGLDRRRSNQELADIALQESAAARTAAVQSGAYQNYQDANKKEGFSLGKDQSRYEYNPETGSYETVGGGQYGETTTSGSYTQGSNPTIDSYIKAIQDGTAKIGDIPDEYKDMVMQGLSGSAKPQSEISKQAVSVIGELLTNPKLDRIFGPADQFVGGMFGDAALAKNKYDQLKGLLSLDNIKYLKGTGAISDAEQKLLANAASALGRNLGNTQARQVLTQLRDDLNALQTQGGGQEQGGEVIQTSAGPVNTNW